MSRQHDRLIGKRLKSARWRRLRRIVFERAGWRCEECGRAGRLECDHKVPLHRGGEVWALSNLQALCRGCHIEKSRRERPEIPLQDPERQKWRERLRRLGT